jgi:eukaryotic-like serine/threonine-protein kinase
VSGASPTEEFGPYLVYEQLGVGGMAQVHRAVAKNFEVRRPVALKRMLTHIAGNEEMVKSFVREARLTSYLRHPNVPQTYDLGRVDDVYFIAMELITGRNLREVLKHCARTTGPMPVPIALNILNQICDALDYAHNLRDDTGEPLGIIHRDVSPSNVIVSETGVVKLIDFGIAKVSGGGMQTMSGALKGKFAYMAPEYLAGQIDARADLWAIGVIAHELLTNRPLFSGPDDVDTMRRVSSMPIAPPSQKNPRVPPEIDDVVKTALVRDPTRRWQHATALRTALTTLTQRLDLVATNLQVVQWLDWAFNQAMGAPQIGDRPQIDTEIDVRLISDEPSISIEQGTAQLLRSQSVPPVMSGGRFSPPAGHPAHAAAPQPSPVHVTDPGSGPAVTIRGSALGPRVESSPAAAPAARSSSMLPASSAAFAPPPVDASGALPPALLASSARASSTVLGTSAPAPRTGRISTPPAIPANATPMSAALLAHLHAAQNLGAPGVHAHVAPRSAANAAPARTTPGVGAPASAAPVFPTPRPAQGAPGRTSRLLVAVLVVLAAAIAVVTVYFVLPLLL